MCLAGDFAEALAVGVADDWADQPFVECDGEAGIDVAASHQMVSAHDELTWRRAPRPVHSFLAVV